MPHLNHLPSCDAPAPVRRACSFVLLLLAGCAGLQDFTPWAGIEKVSDDRTATQAERVVDRYRPWVGLKARFFDLDVRRGATQ